MGKTAVFIIRTDGFQGLEGYFAQRLSRYLLKGEGQEEYDIFELVGLPSSEVKEIKYLEGYQVIVLIYGDLYITAESIKNLSRIANKHKDISVIVPVSNESMVSDQRYPPPFLYQTPSIFKWAVSNIYKNFGDEIIEVKEVDNFCLAFRREILDILQDNYPLSDIPDAIKNKGLRFGVAKGVYVHRYGNCCESGREDLIKHIPLDAVDVLDVGCANGLFGEMLKKRQRCIVTGVDSDTKVIDIARDRLDFVIHGDIEKIIDEGVLEEYDCIVCGDVLEHLRDPWRVVGGLKRHLRDGGLFIASTPNIANWAIIYEMLNGRWDYVPFSILSGTHIRFFTKSTFKELFEEIGYKIKAIFFQHIEIPDNAMEFISSLKRLSPEVDEEELKVTEILIVAQKV